MAEFEIVRIDEEDSEETNPVAIVEATGKLAAMNGAARGLGGAVSHTKTYQQNRPILWLGGLMYVARRRKTIHKKEND